MTGKHVFWIAALSWGIAAGACVSGGRMPSQQMEQAETTPDSVTTPAVNTTLAVDTLRGLLHALANNDTTGRWPVDGQPLPLPGAILPHKRIVAYYGNLYSKQMGILGELPPDEMLDRLDKEVTRWEQADSSRAVVPALHYIAVVAQGAPGRDGKYRTRMPFSQIDSVLRIAERRDALVFLDIQVALSTIEQELPRLDTFLRLPHVHLGIDPEFSMKDGSPPGRRIGWFHADDINFVTDHLAALVRNHNLPPKVLVVHRFTQGMVRDYLRIRLHPEVQTVVHMDGWGAPALKKDTYRRYVYREPVQFTGFKLFYKNDVKNPPHKMLSPEEIVSLTPIPVYIQYQ